LQDLQEQKKAKRIHATVGSHRRAQRRLLAEEIKGRKIKKIGKTLRHLHPALR
jgi:hypothetical protein